jgi:hypothetical protein
MPGQLLENLDAISYGLPVGGRVIEIISKQPTGDVNIPDLLAVKLYDGFRSRWFAPGFGWDYIGKTPSRVAYLLEKGHHRIAAKVPGSPECISENPQLLDLSTKFSREFGSAKVWFADGVVNLQSDFFAGGAATDLPVQFIPWEMRLKCKLPVNIYGRMRVTTDTAATVVAAIQSMPAELTKQHPPLIAV